MGWRWGSGKGRSFSLDLKVIKIDRGQRKYFEVMWYLPQVNINKLHAVFELVGACFGEEVGGFLVMLNV